MNIVLKILDFCNLLDYSQKRLSLTNLALISLVLKLIITRNPDLSTIGTTVIAFANYMQRRSANNSKEDT